MKMRCCASGLPSFIPVDLVGLQCTVSKACYIFHPSIDIYVRESKTYVFVCVCVCVCVPAWWWSEDHRLERAVWLCLYA